MEPNARFRRAEAKGKTETQSLCNGKGSVRVALAPAFPAFQCRRFRRVAAPFQRDSSTNFPTSALYSTISQAPILKAVEGAILQ
jgi:hypothetical protein